MYFCLPHCWFVLVFLVTSTPSPKKMSTRTTTWWVICSHSCRCLFCGAQCCWLLSVILGVCLALVTSRCNAVITAALLRSASQFHHLMIWSLCVCVGEHEAKTVSHQVWHSTLSEDEDTWRMCVRARTVLKLFVSFCLQSSKIDPS